MLNIHKLFRVVGWLLSQLVRENSLWLKETYHWGYLIMQSLNFVKHSTFKWEINTEHSICLSVYPSVPVSLQVSLQPLECTCIIAPWYLRETLYSNAILCVLISDSSDICSQFDDLVYINRPYLYSGFGILG